MFIGLTALSVGPKALSAVPESSATAPYLLAGAPTFDMSISDFREKFNAANPKLQLNEFRAIASSRDRENLTRAASKINEIFTPPRRWSAAPENKIECR